MLKYVMSKGDDLPGEDHSLHLFGDGFSVRRAYALTGQDPARRSDWYGATDSAGGHSYDDGG